MDGFQKDRALLQALCTFAGLQPSRVAQEIGVSSTTILRPFNGSATTRLSQTTIDKLKSRFADFPGWADYLGVELPLSDRRLPFHGQQPQLRSDMVELGQIDLSYGLGAMVMDEEIGEHQLDRMAFPRTWLRMVTTSAPDQLVWARGAGNSMEPSIHDGEVILIDRSQKSLLAGDLIWACAYGQSGMVKRLRQMPDGSVKILSDNPSVPPEVAYDGELTIFGRVVAVVKRL